YLTKMMSRDAFDSKLARSVASHSTMKGRNWLVAASAQRFFPMAVSPARPPVCGACGPPHAALTRPAPSNPSKLGPSTRSLDLCADAPGRTRGATCLELECCITD